MPSPIALFAYNRLDHLQKTVDALLQNKLASETDLFCFSDGPKSEKDTAAIKKIRAYVSNLKGFKSVQLIASSTNKGLANSIIHGVTEVLKTHPHCIVMEDDLVTHPSYLEYMNFYLEKLADNKDVISIHGYVDEVADLPEFFFLRGADCWGWATWSDRWKLFEPDGLKLLQSIQSQGLENQFDRNGSYPFMKMLKNQVMKRNNSWAIRWHASAFLANKLTLYPGKTLVQNIGLDGSGTHCDNDGVLLKDFSTQSFELKWPIEVFENKDAEKKIELFYKAKQKPLLQKVKHKILNLFS